MHYPLPVLYVPFRTFLRFNKVIAFRITHETRSRVLHTPPSPGHWCLSKLAPAQFCDAERVRYTLQDTVAEHSIPIPPAASGAITYVLVLIRPLYYFGSTQGVPDPLEHMHRKKSVIAAGDAVHLKASTGRQGQKV